MVRGDGRPGKGQIGPRLTAELRRLQDLGLGTALRRVIWAPGLRTDVEAEVVQNALSVYVYAEKADTAMRALRHEVVHFELAAVVTPLVGVINGLIAGANAEVYRREERLAETLAGLLDR